MSEYKEKDPHYCKVCGERLQIGESTIWVKPKYGPKFYVHTDCVKTRGVPHRD